MCSPFGTKAIPEYNENIGNIHPVLAPSPPRISSSHSGTYKLERKKRIKKSSTAEARLLQKKTGKQGGGSSLESTIEEDCIFGCRIRNFISNMNSDSSTLVSQTTQKARSCLWSIKTKYIFFFVLFQGKSNLRPKKGDKTVSDKKENLKNGENIGKDKAKPAITIDQMERNFDKNFDKEGKEVTSMPSQFSSIFPTHNPSISPTISTPNPSRLPSVPPSISDIPTSFPICDGGSKSRNMAMYYSILGKVYNDDEVAAENLVTDSIEREVLCWLSHGEGKVIEPDDFFLKEKFGLAFIYTQMGGTNWNVKSSWFETGDACSWHGIQCNARRQSIERISLCKCQIDKVEQLHYPPN